MSMYRCVRSRVYSNGQVSESFACKLGVRQGECLSPFLFAVYVNDLEYNMRNTGAGVTVNDMKIFLHLYADDAVIFSETPTGLQSGINELQKYCERWKLTLNTTKSRIVVFRKGNRPVSFQWKYDEDNLESVSKIKYLGLMISSNGSFNQTQITVAEQANKATFALHIRLNDFRNIKPHEMMTLFDRYISPILNYGCEVWGFHKAPNIERVHLNFCKRILQVKRTTQNDFSYDELGRYPMFVCRQIRIIKYWLNIVSGRKAPMGQNQIGWERLDNYCLNVALGKHGTTRESAIRKYL